MTHDPVAVFSAVFAAIYAAHHVGDHWVQRDHDARHKGLPGWAGQRACASHVFSMTLTKIAFLITMLVATHLSVNLWAATAGLAVDAISHYWADRRTTLARLAELVPGKKGFYLLGRPRTDHDDNPCLGTGAYALDQSWHIGWLFVAALIVVI